MPSADVEASGSTDVQSGPFTALPKMWIFAAVVLLVTGSVAVGYFVRPNLAPESAQSIEQRAALPVPVQPNTEGVEQASQLAKAQTQLEAIAPSSGGSVQADLAVSGVTGKTETPLPPSAPQASPPSASETGAVAAPEPPAKPDNAVVEPAAPPAHVTPVMGRAVAEKADTPDVPATPAAVSALLRAKEPPTPPQSALVPEPPKPAVPPAAPAASTPTAAKVPPKAQKPAVQTASRPKPPKRTVPPVAANSAYFVQLASVKSQRAANREWARLKKRFAALFGSLEPSIQKTSIAKRGTFYRLRAAGFETKKQARDLCMKMKSAGQGCLVVRR